MRSALAMLAVLVFAQCQSQVQALRFTQFVRMWEEDGSSPVCCFDGLWLREHGVICEMQGTKDVHPNAGMPWRVVARFGQASELPRTAITTEVQVPSALADRLVALAKRGQEPSDEQTALAAALIAADVVSNDPLWREIQTVLDAQTQPSR